MMNGSLEALLFLILMSFGSYSKHAERYIPSEDLVFDYKNNGRDWGNQFPICKGDFQSPIEIQIPLQIDADVKLQMKWSPYTVQQKMVKEKYTFSFSGHLSMIEVRDVNGRKLAYRGTQIEIHAPAEHNLLGQKHDVQVHIIHQLYGESKLHTKNTKAILVLFFVAYYKSEESVLFNAFDIDQHGQKIQLVPSRDLGPYFAEQRLPFYTYQGSRTRPPCTEDVNWFLIERTYTMSLEQLQQINSYFKDNFEFAERAGNNRAIVDSQGRDVKQGIVIFGGRSLLQQQIKFIKHKRLTQNQNHNQQQTHHQRRNRQVHQEN